MVNFKHKVEHHGRFGWRSTNRIAGKLVFVLLFSCLPTLPGLAMTPKILPAKAFFADPKRFAYTISPDGKKLAFLKSSKSHLELCVRSISEKRQRLITTRQVDSLIDRLQEALQFGRSSRVEAERNRDIATYFWKNNRFILFLRETTQGNEVYHLYRVDLETRAHKAEDLTPFEGSSVQIIDRLDGISANDVLVNLSGDASSSISGPHRLNVLTGKLDPKSLVDNVYGIQTWIADHSGRIRAGIAQKGVQSSLLTRPDDKTEFKTVLTTDFQESILPVGYTFDNQYLYAISNLGRDKAALVKLDPATGREVKVICQPDVDVLWANLSPVQKDLTDVVFEKTKLERACLDPVTEKIYQRLQREFPGHVIWLTSHDEAEQRFIVEVANDRTPGTRYLFDRRTDRLCEKLSEANPAFNYKDAASTKPIEYASSDGWTINGYLTLPTGRAKTALPAVILPHGGPWARDCWGYNAEVQFLANRGYAVLQINFRGSTGYGRKFWEAGFKEWGGKMQDDITAGVRWLIDSKIADPKRIAICGESYGGYAALAGVTLTPDLYKAAVDRAGPCDLLNLVKPLPERWSWAQPELYIKIGDPDRDSEMLTARSPLFHVDQIKAPVFIAHGTNDQRVKISQSQEIVSALKKRGRNVEFLWCEGEGHVFHSEQARIAYHEHVAAFLDKYLRD
jgi:dipeptidyl aminopeptidase/acylaminoacyl peptidase